MACVSASARQENGLRRDGYDSHRARHRRSGQALGRAPGVADRDVTSAVVGGGVPVLLNTSFNENEPIVHQPEEALLSADADGCAGAGEDCGGEGNG